MVAAVGRLEQSAARPAARHHVRHAKRFPQRRVEDLRVTRIESDLDSACLVVAVEHVFPGLAAVSRSEDATFLIRAGRMPEGGDVHHIGIGRMDANFRDRLAVSQADVGPGFSGVGRFVDAVALRDVAAQLAFARAYVNDVRVGRRHRDSADRRGRQASVRDGGPRHAAVRRFPQSAAGRTKVVLVRPGCAADDRNRAAAARRPDAAPLERAERQRLFIIHVGRPFQGRHIDRRHAEQKYCDESDES